jgi:hypothetical protein
MSSNQPLPCSLRTVLTVAGALCLLTACFVPCGSSKPGEEPLLLVPPSSGDADLDELRRLAMVAPARELLDQHVEFLAGRDRHYCGDPFLWHGIRRLCLMVPGMPDGTSRRLLAKMLIQAIEQQRSPPEFDLPRELDRLRIYAR